MRCVSIPYQHACVPTIDALSFLSRFRDAWSIWSMQVVLADKYDSYRMTYEGCHVFNPGRFMGRSLGFSTYTPASRESEAWYVICLSLFPSRSAYHASDTEKQHYHSQRRGVGSRDLTDAHTDPTTGYGIFGWEICSYYSYSSMFSS